ncbi:hypothetical protein A5781_01615 [Mycobacterium sp. 852002-30065_SCH5024008]|nr:hypothetical protein A5781_01615 [Mycobacterium sp. 852002-30065_SCH5024008]
MEQFLGSGSRRSGKRSATFGRRDLSGTDYVYRWVDDIHLKVGLEQTKLCLQTSAQFVVCGAAYKKLMSAEIG